MIVRLYHSVRDTDWYGMPSTMWMQELNGMCCLTGTAPTIMGQLVRYMDYVLTKKVESGGQYDHTL